jgi:hypothetical protein
MPYRSTKQRAYIHARAAEGVPWAQKFVKDADKAAQPTNTRALGERLKERRKRRRS